MVFQSRGGPLCPIKKIFFNNPDNPGHSVHGDAALRCPQGEIMPLSPMRKT